MSQRPLRVVFLGTPAFAVPSVEGVVRSGADLRAVVCQPDRPKGRGQALAAPPVKEWAVARGIPVLQPEKVRNGRLRALLEPFDPDVLVVTAYGRVLPKEVLELPPHGALNAHASLLPKYRGAAPIQWAIARGETETGISVMQMDEGLDTGDVLLERRLDIGPEETAIELHDRLAVLAGEALEEVLRRLEQGPHPLPRTPQDHASATLAPLLKKEDGWLDLRRPAQELVNRIRGFQPWPGAVLFREGKPFKVHRARVGDRDTGAGVEPGTVVATGDALSIATGRGTLDVLEIQPEGRRRMSAREFVAGQRLAPGDRFDRVG